MSREELLSRFPALRGDIHASDPLVDQIEAAAAPDRAVYKAVRKRGAHELIGHRGYSQSARFHPEISAAIDRSKEVKTTVPEMDWFDDNGFDYVHSNLPDRRTLQECNEGHVLDAAGSEHSARVDEFRDGMATATTGPVGVRGVLLIDPQAPVCAPSLPWTFTQGEDVSPGLVVFPVAHGYSTERVARAAMWMYASTCHWCSSGSPDWGLLYSAGATTYVLPTCGGCRWNLDEDLRLDFICNDGWDFRTGFPSDQHR